MIISLYLVLILRKWGSGVEYCLLHDDLVNLIITGKNVMEQFKMFQSSTAIFTTPPPVEKDHAGGVKKNALVPDIITRLTYFFLTLYGKGHI